MSLGRPCHPCRPSTRGLPEDPAALAPPPGLALRECLARLAPLEDQPVPAGQYLPWDRDPCRTRRVPKSCRRPVSEKFSCEPPVFRSLIDHCPHYALAPA